MEGGFENSTGLLADLDYQYDLYLNWKFLVDIKSKDLDAEDFSKVHGMKYSDFVDIIRKFDDNPETCYKPINP